MIESSYTGELAQLKLKVEGKEVSSTWISSLMELSASLAQETISKTNRMANAGKANTIVRHLGRLILGMGVISLISQRNPVTNQLEKYKFFFLEASASYAQLILLQNDYASIPNWGQSTINTGNNPSAAR
jgi:hypothetical protein